MNYLFQMNVQDRADFSKNWKWFLMWGIAFVILGMLAITYAFFTTILSVIILGSILAVAGVVILIDAFHFWWRRWGGFGVHLLIGLLYLIIGIMFIQGPVLASISVTIFLASFFVVIGIFRIINYAGHRQPRWGWGFFNGIITLILGLLIFAGLPASGLFIVGLFIGIDLLLCGWVYIAAALAAA